MEDITMDTARKEAEEMKKKEAERKARKEAEKAKKKAEKEAKAAAKPKKEPHFDNITDETAYREAQAMKAKEAARKEAGGGFWDRIKGNMGSAPKTEAPVAEEAAPAAEANPDTISNSLESQANAKPGDVVNGVTLTQGDIDWARNKLGMYSEQSQESEEVGTDSENIESVEPSTTEAENTSDVSTEMAESNIDAPEIVESKPDLASPEVQKAIGAGGAEIEDATGDEAKQENFKQKYCNAIWENYDQGMQRQPKFKPGWQLPATILSIGLSVFSGGLVPPVNFMKLTGKEDEFNAAMDMWKETMGTSGELAQEQERSSTMPTAKAEGMQGAEGIASQSAIDQASEVNAAEGGAQAQARLGTEGEIEVMAKQAEIDYNKLDQAQANEIARLKLEQLHEDKMKRLDATLAKELAADTAYWQKELLKATNAGDMDKIRELYRQSVEKQGDVLNALGYDVSPDGFLKYMRNTGATSNAQARMKQALEFVDTAGDVAGKVIEGLNPLK